jgi:hypothetical protein
MVQTVEIFAKGDDGVIPANRKLNIRFKNVCEGKLALKVNGVAQPVVEKLADELVAVIDFESGNRYEITATFKKQTRLQRTIARTVKILLSAECENYLKWREFDRLKTSVSLNDYAEKVKTSALSEKIKARLLETI